MAPSTDNRLALAERWYAAYGDRDIDTMLELADPEIEIAPVEPSLTDLPGATFHGHEGLRTVARWSYDNYPRLHLESSNTRKIPGWILGSATFVLDNRTTPVRKRHTEALFAIYSDRIRRVRIFLSGSQALEAATGEPMLTAREGEIFQLLARGTDRPGDRQGTRPLAGDCADARAERRGPARCAHQASGRVDSHQARRDPPVDEPSSAPKVL
jgi:hypothetical protein